MQTLKRITRALLLLIKLVHPNERERALCRICLVWANLKGPLFSPCECGGAVRFRIFSAVLDTELIAFAFVESFHSRKLSSRLEKLTSKLPLPQRVLHSRLPVSLSSSKADSPFPLASL
jgi:hypothetical protein